MMRSPEPADDLQIQLRDVVESDFPILFEHQRDPVSARMATFGTRDQTPDEFAARWTKSIASGSTTTKVIVLGEQVVGFVASFLREERLEVTYWIARSHWGRGIATAALSQLLKSIATRPIYASAARDNLASLRVLEKCGFTVRGVGKDFSNSRGEEVEEVFLDLR